MKKYILPIVAIAFIIGIGIYNEAKAYITLDTSTLTVQYRIVDFFATSTNQGPGIATSTSATSTDISGYFDTSGRYDNGIAYIGGAKKVTLYFGRSQFGGINTGTSTFRIQVTPDGSNWYDYNKLIQNIATSTTNVTPVTSVTISAATSTTITSMDLVYDNFYGIRCIETIAGNGQNTCRATIAY